MVRATLSEDQLRKGGDFLTRWAAASTFFVQDPVDQDLFLSWIKELFLAGGVTTRIRAVEAAGKGTAGYPMLGGNYTQRGTRMALFQGCKNSLLSISGHSSHIP